MSKKERGCLHPSPPHGASQLTTEQIRGEREKRRDLNLQQLFFRAQTHTHTLNSEKQKLFFLFLLSSQPRSHTKALASLPPISLTRPVFFAEKGRFFRRFWSANNFFDDPPPLTTFPSKALFYVLSHAAGATTTTAASSLFHGNEEASLSLSLFLRWLSNGPPPSARLKKSPDPSPPPPPSSSFRTSATRCYT